MALTITSRGTGTHNTGATTLVPGGRDATLAVGSMGVLCIALDNAGAGGAALIAPDSWTDAKGNVWTLRQNALYDPGAASAGIEMAIYTAPITTALLTTDAGTMTWKNSTSPVAKAWTWYEATSSGAGVAYSTGNTIAGATAANAQVITASVAVGDGVICGYFSENVAAVTGDTDNTNGTWGAPQTTTIGSGTSGVRISTQQKVQITAASTQSYDVTVASQDRIAGYIMLHEVVNTTLTPGTRSVVVTGFAPTVRQGVILTPGTKSLAVTGFAPSISVSQNHTLTPGTKELAVTGFAPSVSVGTVLTPGPRSLSVTGFAPTVTVSSGVVLTPGTKSLTVTGFAPTVTVSSPSGGISGCIGPGIWIGR